MNFPGYRMPLYAPDTGENLTKIIQQEGSEPKEATRLIPDFTYDDFANSDKPYAWLYGQKENPFLQQQLLQKVNALAKSLKYTNFLGTWKKYLEIVEPQQQQVYGGDFVTMFPEQPVQLKCGRYIADQFGIGYVGRLGEDVEVCSHPLMPVKRFVDIETGHEKMTLSFKRGNGSWKSLTKPRDMLATASKIVSLASEGIAVNSENAKEIVKYITEVESLNYDELPCQEIASHLGWVNGSFVPYDDNPICDKDCLLPEMKDTVHQQGDYTVWRKKILSYRTGSKENLPLRILLAASFAAPLVEPFKMLPFFVHVTGGQGIGKTLSLTAAASVWADPQPGRWIQTFNTTGLAFLNRAAFAYSLPVCLDEGETKSGKDREKELQDFIYTFCNGTGKDQGRKEGGNRLKHNWHTVCISTGERELTTSCSKTGSLVRVIDVSFPPGKKLVQSGDESSSFVNTLFNNFGFAGPEFIRQFKTADMTALSARLDQLKADLEKMTTGKQSASAALLLLADELAEKFVFHDGIVLTVNDLKPFLKTEEEVDNNLRACQILFDWLVSNRANFVFGGRDGDKPEEYTPRQLLGRVEGNVYFLLKTELDKFFRANNISPKLFLEWAYSHGAIVDHATEKDPYHHCTQKYIGGSRIDVWEIRIVNLEQLDPQTGMTIVDEDVPF